MHKRTLRYLPYVMEVLLLVALGYGMFSWFFSGDEYAFTASKQVEQTLKHSWPSASGIAAVPLFGEQARKDIPPAEPTPLVQVKPLAIRLLGTVAAGKRSWAIVADMQAQHQRSIHVGDWIEAGVRLKHVDANAIVVERNGRNKLVVLEHPKKLQVEITESEGAESRKREGGAPELKKARVSQVPAMSILMTQADLVPHQVKGKMDGFLISNIIFGSAYQRAGLFNGDIIRKVNGIALTKQEQISELLTGLQKTKDTKLEVQRAGAMHQIQWKF